MRIQLISTLSVFGLGLIFSNPALAQEAPPEGLLKTDAASSGSTDVAAEGFKAAVKDDPEAKDATEAKISAGGLFTSGNSRAVTATAAADTRLRRGPNQFVAALAANYGRSAQGPKEPMETTVENIQGKVRYDRFLTGSLAAFLSVTGRRDRFQGLNLRLNIDPGLAYYFVDEAAQQLWAELGYDLQYDIRRDEAIASDPTLDKTEARHSVRAFAGYNNALSETVAFNTGLEYIQSVQESKFFRINWDVGLTASISDKFSLATTFQLKYDNSPLPEIEKLDTITAISLVYTIH